MIFDFLNFKKCLPRVLEVLGVLKSEFLEFNSQNYIQSVFNLVSRQGISTMEALIKITQQAKQKSQYIE